MRALIKSHIGQILLNGRFMSSRELDRALEEQKRTKELLGKVLVRMGVVKERDFKIPLILQPHLSDIDDAVKIAAGERELLGELLVHSGTITKEQLDQAIAEQKSSGEQIGEVFIRLGILKEKQLTALLDFQKNQGNHISNPLRLGELLVATGHISRKQLDDALRKQTVTHKRLGEVLVEEGYVRPSLVKYGICMQKMLVGSVLAGIISLGAGGTSVASSIVLQWDPSADTDVTGYKVYTAPGSTPLESAVPVDAQKLTTATLSGLDPGQSHSFAVTAYDASGAESAFSNVVSIAETQVPTVTVTSPADAVSVSGIVSISVTAADNVGISKVEFYVNGVLKVTDTATPYVYSWDTRSLAAGVYTLMAKAYDAAGNVGQSATSTVTVVNDLVPPVTAVTSPLNNAVLSGTVAISSSASDNIAVSNVEFYINGVFVYASNVPPYSFNWDTKGVANGTYSITSKAYDSAGNSAQSAPVTVSVNNAVLPAPSVLSAWSAAAVPGVVDAGPNGAVELGVKFRTDLAGTITGVRFYKAATNTGTHIANLWENTGKLLATATFTNETPSGWQQVTFPTPVPIAANTVYVASYHNVGGHYSDDQYYFAGKGVDNGPLHLLADGVSGASGVYAYGTTSSFPNSGWNSSNYWVDVMYSAGAAAQPDVTAPTLGSFTLPAASTSLTVPVSGFTASDNVAVTGYMITESATAPLSGASGWSSAAPASFTFSSGGVKTAYAWVKDAAGNVSASRSASVTITLPDVTAPTLSSFTLPATSASLTVPVTGFTASDNVAVTGYMITESSTKPLSGATGWGSAAPASFTFSSEGVKTAYAWVKDAAGNVSASRSASVTIKVPDVTAPVVALTNLAANSILSGTIAITASASDNVAVSRVEFYVNGVLKATDAAAPYSFNWDTTAVPNGAYNLVAKAYDAAGNVGQSSTIAVSVNNVAVSSIVTAWSSATVPGVVDAGPDGAVELGVKFRSDVAGTITGIRFYKAATNTGTHVGNLWSSRGKLLATATFTKESASGWQQVNFATPVAIAANTVYVASYHTNVGHYSDDQYYFAGKGVDNGPLHLLADGVSGASGVYAYGTASKFPNQGWNSSNYWVDVVLKK